MQFDHVSEPYDVERVKSRFVVKNFYVYRTQFPLILAYAITINKCQGLSLDCAIVDLSEKVFSLGMAHVAISQVRTLAGLHLVAFEPNSIMVSTSCLKEFNHRPPVRAGQAARAALPGNSATHTCAHCRQRELLLSRIFKTPHRHGRQPRGRPTSTSGPPPS